MISTRRSLMLATLLFALAAPACAFRWSLTDILPANRVLQFSERYMFATHDGPDMLAQGESYIDINMDVISYMEVNRSTEVAYAVYAANVGHEHDTLLGMCAGDANAVGETGLTIEDNSWAANVFSARGRSEYMDTVDVHSWHFGDSMGLANGTYYRWKTRLNTHYTVNSEAWHNVAFQLCDSETADPKAHVDGNVTFHNPYGYVPAELFGFIPFEGLRMTLFAVFGIWFLREYIKHSDSTLPLHKATLVVFIIAFVEAASWFVAYLTINSTGTPYCCPFPPTVVFSLVLQIFRQTFSRLLLLVVSLGYGIVRPKLLTSEWVVVTVLVTLYFIGSAVAHVSEIVMVHDVHGDSPDHVLPFQVPAMLLDMILLSWIYLALGSTIRILSEFKQTNKLRLYIGLRSVINFFVWLFCFTTVWVMLDKAKILSWPWQIKWLEQVLWEILNFGILSAICILCRPTDSSLLLSYASQIPTDDPDDDDEVDNYNDNDDDEYGDEHDDDDDMPSRSKSRGDVEMAARNPVHDQDETAGDEDIFGDDSDNQDF